MEFQVRYLALFVLFSVIDGFQCDLYSKCDQESDLWQQLDLASQRNIVDWDKKWLVDFNAVDVLHRPASHTIFSYWVG